MIIHFLLDQVPKRVVSPPAVCDNDAGADDVVSGYGTGRPGGPGRPPTTSVAGQRLLPARPLRFADRRGAAVAWRARTVRLEGGLVDADQAGTKPGRAAALVDASRSKMGPTLRHRLAGTVCRKRPALLGRRNRRRCSSSSRRRLALAGATAARRRRFVGPGAGRGAGIGRRRSLQVVRLLRRVLRWPAATDVPAARQQSSARDADTEPVVALVGCPF